MSNILNEIKLLLIYNEMTMTDLVNLTNEKFGKSEAYQNFHRKLSKGTIRYTEILEIAEVLGYRLAWIPDDVKLESGQNGIFYSSSKTIPIRQKLIGDYVRNESGYIQVAPIDNNKKEPSE